MAPKNPVSAVLIARTAVAWLVTLLIFFPLGWLVLTAFKTGAAGDFGAAAAVLQRLRWTTFVEVQRRSDYLLYAQNLLITSVVSTLARPGHRVSGGLLDGILRSKGGRATC
jgi:sorbitol/mannitol transport system permease protein